MLNAVCAGCLVCGDDDALVKLHLDGDGVFECDDCGKCFTIEEVKASPRARSLPWSRIIPWVEAYPLTDDTE